MKKHSIYTTFLIASFLMSAPLSAMAGLLPQGMAGETTDSSGSSSGSNSTGNQIAALAQAGVLAYYNAAYQVDNYLNNYLQANIANSNTQTNVNQMAQGLSTQVMQTNLQTIPYSILTPRGSDSSQISSTQAAQANFVNTLTINVPASDTLYTNNPGVAAIQFQPGSSQFSVAKPTVFNDNYFNIASVIEPVVFTDSQKNAALYFVNYLMQNYNYPTQNINFSLLKSKLTGDPQKQYQYLRNIMTSPVYQGYQLGVRSTAASNSVVLDNLSYLISERTPVKGLGTQANLQDSQGNAIADASPLQVEQYTATHRINNPQWYQHVQGASPANIQRETLLVLAEMESQLYQAHLDHERLLATLSAQQATSAQAAQTLLQTKAQDVNTLIQNMDSSNNAAPNNAQQSPIQNNASSKGSP